ncbi:MAG: MFS transporter, partial [Clostridia bacterium]|nr:MFS transporter [Clostridia bacterium]
NKYKELKGFRQVLYALGHIGPGMLNQFITIWLLLYLTTGESPLVSGTLVGVALMIGRIMDGVADPLVAQMSDNLKYKKFGRRIPFMAIGVIPMVISFNLLWITSTFSSSLFRFIWILIWVNAFYFAYTVVVNPYFALLPEISKDKNQRSYIQGFVALFGILGMGISMGVSGILIDAFSYSIAGLLLSVICVLVMIAPILVVKVNKDYEEPVTKALSKNVFKNIIETFENKNFRNYIVGFSMFFIGFQLIQYNLSFYTTVLLGLAKGDSSLLFITSVVSGILFIPVYNRIVKKSSTQNALNIAVGSYVIVAVLIALSTLIPIGDKKILGLIMMAAIGFPYGGLMVTPNLIISEIIDEDYILTNKRREALFFGVQGLINKFMVALAALAVGVLHDLLGNSTGNSAGVIVIAPLAAAVSLIGAIVIRRMNIKGKIT